MAWLLVAVAVVAAAGLAWALFEAQWVEYLERDAPVPGLPPELDGLRILHISDFHLGTVSLNGRTLRKAVDWAAPRLSTSSPSPATSSAGGAACARCGGSSAGSIRATAPTPCSETTTSPRPGIPSAVPPT